MHSVMDPRITRLLAGAFLLAAGCGGGVSAPADASTSTDSGQCLGDAGLGADASCAPGDCCGVGLACVEGVCSSECAAYGHACSATKPCCMPPPPNVEVCNGLGMCQTL